MVGRRILALDTMMHGRRKVGGASRILGGRYDVRELVEKKKAGKRLQPFLGEFHSTPVRLQGTTKES